MTPLRRDDDGSMKPPENERGPRADVAGGRGERRQCLRRVVDRPGGVADASRGPDHGGRRRRRMMTATAAMAPAALGPSARAEPADRGVTQRSQEGVLGRGEDRMDVAVAADAAGPA